MTIEPPTIDLLGPPLPPLTESERKFFAELADVLDAMPIQRLGADDYVDGECRCVMGEFSVSRNVNPDGHALEDLAAVLRVPAAAAIAAAKVNDDGSWLGEAPEKRWIRVRNWVSARLAIDTEHAAFTC
jgi:hypothetical protein